jgi:hypothetical protein
MELGASLLEFASENSAELGELQPRSKANAQKPPMGKMGQSALAVRCRRLHVSRLLVIRMYESCVGRRSW